MNVINIQIRNYELQIKVLLLAVAMRIIIYIS